MRYVPYLLLVLCCACMFPFLAVLTVGEKMDWYANNKYKEIGNIYEEYREVPSKEMFEGN